jgi:4-amino-4-deoxy-L-arabinose transferase-like glycosyltransferase
MGLALRLIPWNRTLVGWDEWILSTISSRWALVALPEGNLYDLIVPTYYSYPPAFFWLQGLTIFLFGPHPLVWRLVPGLAGALCVALAYLLGREARDEWSGWMAGLLSLSAMYLAFHDTVTIDYLMAAALLGSLIFLLRTLRRPAFGTLLAGVFLASLACFIKYHAVVFYAIVCGAVFAMPVTRRLIHGKRWLVFAVTALVLPISLLAIEGLTWHFYGFAKTHLAEVLRVMTWPSYVAAFDGTGYVQPPWYYYFAYCWITLGPLVCLLCLAGIATALWSPQTRVRFLLAVFTLYALWATTAGLKNARYFIPAVFVAFVLAGVFLSVLKQGRQGRLLAVLLLSAAIIVSGIRTAVRLEAYLTESAHHEQVYAFVNENTPKDALIITESEPFWRGNDIGVHPIKRDVVEPGLENVFDKGDYFISHEMAYELMRAGAIRPAPDFLEDRAMALETWDLVLDLGKGRARVRVWRKPN